MKRCYYISNSYDGAYFVLTDNIEDFAERMTMYMLNLKRSGKCNHYSFGSLEMSDHEYVDFKNKAEGLEREQIEGKIPKEEPKKPATPPLRLV
jgi:hypothetical protein